MSDVFVHALKTVVMLILLWVMPIAVIVTLATVANLIQGSRAKEPPTPIHFPTLKRPAA